MAYEFFKQLTEGKIHKHLDFQGMDISIEIPAGGKRTGTNKKTGEKWEHKIDDAYGYIKGTHSPDGEHLDCYVRRNPDEDADVYVMHQMTVDGSKFDEDKVMLGYSSKAEATKAFKNFTFKPDLMFGGVTEFSLEHFRVMAYQASNSHAMLTDEETYSDFQKRGLLPHGVVSPLAVARRVSEGTDNEVFCHNKTHSFLRGAGSASDSTNVSSGTIDMATEVTEMNHNTPSIRDISERLKRLEERLDPENLDEAEITEESEEITESFREEAAEGEEIDFSECIDYADTYFLDEDALMEARKAPVFSSREFNWSTGKAVAEISDLGLTYWPPMIGIKSERTGQVLYFIPYDDRKVMDAGGEDLIARVYISPGAGENIPEVHILND